MFRRRDTPPALGCMYLCTWLHVVAIVSGRLVSDYPSSAACISPTFMRSGLFTVKPRMDGSSL
jgi:hypothetical protein